MNETELERLLIRLVGDGSSYRAMLSEAQNATRAFVSTVSTVLGAVGLSFGLLSTAIAGVQKAASSESTRVDMEVLLGSAEAAKKMIGDLASFSEHTPLRMPGLLSNAKQLMQMGIEADQVVPILQALGNAAGGSQERLSQMTYVFGRMASIGHVSMREIHMLTTAGFNPLKELSKMTGESVTSLTEKLHKGGITAEMVVRAFNNASKAGGTFAGRLERQSQTLGGLFSTMQDNVSKAVKEIGNILVEGLDLKGIVRDVTEVARTVTGWLQGMSPETKKTIAVVLSIAAAVGTVAAAFVVLGPIVTPIIATIGAVIGGLMGPVGLLIAGIVALVAVWVHNAGGMEAAWGKVKEAALAAWDWMQPILREVRSFFAAVWEAVVDVFTRFADFVTGIWHDIFGDAQVNWDQVREVIITVLAAAEFGIKNFGDVWEVAMAGAKYGLVVLGNYITYLFQTVIPALVDYEYRVWEALWTYVKDVSVAALTWLKDAVTALFVWFKDTNLSIGMWFGDNWQAVVKGVIGYFQDAWKIPGRVIVATFKSIPWGTLWEGLKTSVENQVENVVNAFRNLPGLIKGQLTFAAIWKDETAQAVGNVTDELGKLPTVASRIKNEIKDFKPFPDLKLPEFHLPGFTMPELNIPPRVATELENQLGGVFEGLRTRLGNSFSDFLGQKMKELFGTAGAPGPASKVPVIPQIDPNKFKVPPQQMHVTPVMHWEPALADSAEAVARIQTQADMLAGQGLGLGAHATGHGGGRGSGGPEGMAPGGGLIAQPAEALAGGNIAPVPVQVTSGGDDSTRQQIVTLLSRAVEDLDILAKKPQVNLQPANLAP
jgi:tape measure domain-containing protein